MATVGASRNLVLSALGNHEPKSHREVVKLTGLSEKAVCSALFRCWKSGLLLRTKAPIYKRERIFKGRGGVSGTTRPYHLYVLRPEGIDILRIDEHEFVKYGKEYLDVRGGGRESKAKKIADFLRKHGSRAWFSKEVAETLRGEGVRPADVMANIRRFEGMGQVYVRGYQLDDRQTPFKEGYLVTWIDPDKPRDQALEEAIKKTTMALDKRASASPLMERIHHIRDIILEHSSLRRLVGFTYLQNRLGCSEYEIEHGMTRALQLYPDLKEVKLFNNYRYYYHASMTDEDLRAAVAMKENYLRMSKGRDNRIGHNWEAAAEWFIDKFTTGAKFWTQNHRNMGMDPRRITLHLLKSIGGRRNNAEVDRVWEVTPGIFAPPITYVLSCKWGLVRKRDVDDFLDVLRWSKEFGVDTPEGRKVKQGIVGVFAGSAFNPRESVQLKDETTISLASYAARMEIQLLKAVDFNVKLREKGCPEKATVQAVCRAAKDEEEVREILQAIWKNPEKGEEILAEVIEKNRDVYSFERMLEETRGSKEPAIPIPET